MVEEARDEATATEIVQHKLELEVSKLEWKLEEESPADSSAATSTSGSRGAESLSTLDITDSGAARHAARRTNT